MGNGRVLGNIRVESREHPSALYVRARIISVQCRSHARREPSAQNENRIIVVLALCIACKRLSGTLKHAANTVATTYLRDRMLNPLFYVPQLSSGTKCTSLCPADSTRKRHSSLSCFPWKNWNRTDQLRNPNNGRVHYCHVTSYHAL